MAKRSAQLNLRDGLRSFVAERHPLGLSAVLGVFDVLKSHDDLARVRDHMRTLLPDAVRTQLTKDAWPAIDTTPGIGSDARVTQAANELIEAVDGFLARTVISQSFSNDERLEMLRGMILTRAVDNRLKQFFSGGEVKYGSASFQGKGFRSLGQEAIYAAPLRFRRGPTFRSADGGWTGDVVAPLIREYRRAAVARRRNRGGIVEIRRPIRSRSRRS